MANPPTVLISWSHGDRDMDAAARADRAAKVLALANSIREAGIDAEVDLYHQHEGVDWSRWGPALVASVDYVLVVQSVAWGEAWLGTAPPTIGAGAAAEADVLRSIYKENRADFVQRVRLIGLPGETAPVPRGMDNVTVYTVDSLDVDGVEDIVRDLTRQPRIMKPPLGPPRQLPPTPPPTAGSSPSRRVWYSPLVEEVPVAWRSLWDTSASQGPPVIAVHLFSLPINGMSLRAVSEAAKVVARAFREQNLVPDTAAISTEPRNDSVVVTVDQQRRRYGEIERGEVLGARISTSGQMSSWRSLPRDLMGAVLDEDALTDAIVAALQLATVMVPGGAAHISVALELNGLAGITDGRIVDLGRRHQAKLLGAARSECRVEADEAIRAVDLANDAAEIARVLVPMLLERWRRSP